MQTVPDWVAEVAAKDEDQDPAPAPRPRPPRARPDPAPAPDSEEPGWEIVEPSPPSQAAPYPPSPETEPYPGGPIAGAELPLDVETGSESERDESLPPAEMPDPDQPRPATVRDPTTGLTWLSSDNNRDVDWATAKAFCESYSASSSANWRLPTLTELESLYDPQSQNEYRTRLGISMTGICTWSSQSRAPGLAQYFVFMNGESGQISKATSEHQRAICVSGG